MSEGRASEQIRPCHAQIRLNQSSPTTFSSGLSGLVSGLILSSMTKCDERSRPDNRPDDPEKNGSVIFDELAMLRRSRPSVQTDPNSASQVAASYSGPLHTEGHVRNIMPALSTAPPDLTIGSGRAWYVSGILLGRSKYGAWVRSCYLWGRKSLRDACANEQIRLNQSSP